MSLAALAALLGFFFFGVDSLDIGELEFPARVLWDRVFIASIVCGVVARVFWFWDM
jgi:hypothetical protein